MGEEDLNEEEINEGFIIKNSKGLDVEEDYDDMEFALLNERNY